MGRRRAAPTAPVGAVPIVLPFHRVSKSVLLGCALLHEVAEGAAVEKHLPEVAARECTGDGAREHSFLNVTAARTTVTFLFSFRISGQRNSASKGPHHFLFVSRILHLAGKS